MQDVHHVQDELARNLRKKLSMLMSANGTKKGFTCVERAVDPEAQPHSPGSGAVDTEATVATNADKKGSAVDFIADNVDLPCEESSATMRSAEADRGLGSSRRQKEYADHLSQHLQQLKLQQLANVCSKDLGSDKQTTHPGDVSEDSQEAFKTPPASAGVGPIGDDEISIAARIDQVLVLRAEAQERELAELRETVEALQQENRRLASQSLENSSCDMVVYAGVEDAAPSPTGARSAWPPADEQPALSSSQHDAVAGVKTPELLQSSGSFCNAAPPTPTPLVSSTLPAAIKNSSVAIVSPGAGGSLIRHIAAPLAINPAVHLAHQQVLSPVMSQFIPQPVPQVSPQALTHMPQSLASGRTHLPASGSTNPAPSIAMHPRVQAPGTRRLPVGQQHSEPRAVSAGGVCQHETRVVAGGRAAVPVAPYAPYGGPGPLGGAYAAAPHLGQWTLPATQRSNSTSSKVPQQRPASLSSAPRRVIGPDGGRASYCATPPKSRGATPSKGRSSTWI